MNQVNSRNDLCHDNSTINIVPGIIIIIIIIIITGKFSVGTMLTVEVWCGLLCV